MTDPSYQSARQLLRAIRERETSARELLEHFAGRVERLNGAINAVVATNLEMARQRADEADAATARGESWGPLHGLPMTIKDAIEVVGMPTTSGAPQLAHHRPQRNADSVQRLIDAGTVIFGKTNLPLYAGDFQSYNEVYGTSNNPWDLARSPGGSSGGSAAALAAGLAPLELGSDIGGSIRNPAHFCGVYGHKPSWGIVSGRGHIPGPPGALAEPDLAVIGPLARSPGDLSLALDVLAAPRPEDQPGWRLDLPAAGQQQIADFRVAVWHEQTGRPIDPEVSQLIRAAAETIASQGARVDFAARPAIDPEESHSCYQRLLYGVLGAGFPGEVLAGFDAALPNVMSEDRDQGAQVIRGASGRHRDWLSDNELRQRIRIGWSEFFGDWDVLLCPVMPTAAFPHDHSPIDARTCEIDGKTYSYFEQLFWAGIATLAYLPSTVIPIGRTRAGLPVGMQVIAGYLNDRTSLRFAEFAETVIGGFVPPPGYAG